MFYGHDPSEIVRRVLGYLKFTGKESSLEDYQALMRRVVPVGFHAMDPAWLRKMPSDSLSYRTYSEEQIKQIDIDFAGRRETEFGTLLDVVLTNRGPEPIARRSDLGKPVRLTWRWLDAQGGPVTGWEPRMELPFDLRPGEPLSVGIPVDIGAAPERGTLQVSLVQEQVFAAHEIGREPLSIPWP